MKHNIVIIDCGSSKTPQIVTCLDELNTTTEVIPLEELKSGLFENAKGIIISGAPILLSQVDKQSYLDKFAWVEDFESPILGICFGHQIIGLLAGAEVSMGVEKRGAQEIDVIASSSLFNAISEELIMEEDHCEEITLAENYKLIASSDTCEVEAVRHMYKPIFGVQFHPEVSGVPGLKLLKNFVKTCS